MRRLRGREYQWPALVALASPILPMKEGSPLLQAWFDAWERKKKKERKDDEDDDEEEKDEDDEGYGLNWERIKDSWVWSGGQSTPPRRIRTQREGVLDGEGILLLTLVWRKRMHGEDEHLD